MRINELYVKNFRNFEEETFRFHPGFTVVIGDNGLGKSSLLAALRVACGTYILGLAGVGKRHIRNEEIRLKNFESHVAPQYPVVVAVNDWEWQGVPQITKFKREIPTNANKTTSSEEQVGAARQYGQEISNKINNLGASNVDCPIIAFFGTERLHGAGQNRGDGDAIFQRQIITQGYENWESMKATSYKYSKWLKGLNPDNETDLNKRKLFLATIKLAIPYIETIRDSGGQLFIQSNINGFRINEMPIDKLSDGMQVLTEMVAELTYRCIVLNWHHGENTVKNTFGIVMIDELDMHLHPNWQRHVVGDLQKAFPNIQFIATTHSPFIVQSLESSMLWNLGTPVDINPSLQDIDTVSEKIMKVVSRFSIQNEKEYKRLISLNPEDFSDPLIRALHTLVQKNDSN